MLQPDPVEFLVLRMFPGRLVNNARTAVCEGQYRESAEDYTERARIYEAVLRTLPGRALAALVEDERELDSRLDEERAATQDQYRAFSKPSASASFDNWCRRSCWSLDEATALILGKDPDMVRWDMIKPLLDISPFAQRFFGIRRHLKSAHFKGELSDPVNPHYFVSWAMDAGVVLPPPLERRYPQMNDEGGADRNAADEAVKAAVPAPEKPSAAGHREDDATLRRNITLRRDRRRAEGAGPANIIHIDRQVARLRAMRERADASEGSAGGRENDIPEDTADALVRITLAMAVGRYGYRPGSSRTSTVTDIICDLRRIGLDLPAPTVTQWLRKASDCLQPRIDEDDSGFALGSQS